MKVCAADVRRCIRGEEGLRQTLVACKVECHDAVSAAREGCADLGDLRDRLRCLIENASGILGCLHRCTADALGGVRMCAAGAHDCVTMCAEESSAP